MCEFSRDEWEADHALNNYDCFPDFEVWQEEGYLLYKNEKTA